MEPGGRVGGKTDQVAVDCAGSDFGVVLGKPVDRLLPRERLPRLQRKGVGHVLHEEPYWFRVDGHRSSAPKHITFEFSGCRRQSAGTKG